MPKHTVYGVNSERDGSVELCVVEHNGEYKCPVRDAYEPDFFDDDQPATLEGDRVLFGWMGEDRYSVFVVEHANGDSASFLRSCDMRDYLAERFHAD